MRRPSAICPAESSEEIAAGEDSREVEAEECGESGGRE